MMPILGDIFKLAASKMCKNISCEYNEACLKQTTTASIYKA